jgi:hypothetical protein
MSRKGFVLEIKTSAPSISAPRSGVFAERNQAFILDKEAATADAF